MYVPTDHAAPAADRANVVTDSPWFWLLVFAAMALVMLTVMDHKYGRRQVQIEQQSQGREWARQKALDPESEPDVAFSQDGQPVVTLWPLRVVSGLILLVSSAALVRRQVRGGT